MGIATGFDRRCMRPVFAEAIRRTADANVEAQP
jgi:hypothetical protein